MSKYIYMDNAATTPIKREVLEAMMPYFTDKYGNPSSIYSIGGQSRNAIERAREKVSKVFNAKPQEIFLRVAVPNRITGLLRNSLC